MADVPTSRGGKLSQGRIDHEDKGEEEDGEVGGDGDRPVLLGEEVEPDGGKDGWWQERPGEVEEEQCKGEEVKHKAVNRSARGGRRAVLGHSSGYALVLPTHYLETFKIGWLINLERFLLLFYSFIGVISCDQEITAPSSFPPSSTSASILSRSPSEPRCLSSCSTNPAFKRIPSVRLCFLSMCCINSVSPLHVALHRRQETVRMPT